MMIRNLNNCCSFKGDPEVALPDAPRGAKKRKLSSIKDSDKSETEPAEELQATGSEQQQPDSKDEAPVHGETGQ